MFGHEKFEIYHTSIEFVAGSTKILEKIPQGYNKLVDQFRRASISIPLNIAEGSGKSTKLQKHQHYIIARGEAMECAAILDVLAQLKMADGRVVENAKGLLEKITAVLTAVCKKQEK